MYVPTHKSDTQTSHIPTPHIHTSHTHIYNNNQLQKIKRSEIA